MVLAERAQALALTKFATMVRQDETQKIEEDTASKAVHSDDLPESPKPQRKAGHKLRTADLLPPIIWGSN